MSYKKARNLVWDHPPVWMRLNMQASPLVLAPHRSEGCGENATYQPSVAKNKLPAVRANRNSKICHLVSCPGYTAMSSKSIVAFDVTRAAEAAGYQMAQNDTS
tara:strand:+ start:456 stop:764 length:309 start_codon:yes stop_codon:yes gene_type:complete